MRGENELLQRLRENKEGSMGSVHLRLRRTPGAQFAREPNCRPVELEVEMIGWKSSRVCAWEALWILLQQPEVEERSNAWLQSVIRQLKQIRRQELLEEITMLKHMKEFEKVITQMEVKQQERERDKEHESRDKERKWDHSRGAFKAKKKVWLELDLAFDMDLDAVTDTVSFKASVIADVARAVGGDSSKIFILGLEGGSIVVKLGLEEGVCGQRVNLSDVCNMIVHQASDPFSPLKKGRFTSMASGAKLQRKSVKSLLETFDGKHVIEKCVKLLNMRTAMSQAKKFVDTWKVRVRVRRLLSRGLQRWRNRNLSWALTIWLGTSAEFRRQRNVIGKVILRMKNGLTSSAFERWRDHTMEKRRMAGVVYRM